ncbi:unnamed protein product [Hyaloperonospora brassicae]|uniref:Uncharacterized protein n=1 Tax=Hyaloperonospora brassicae TaxID=162125 RepID=A0AAV0V219_HYABA|nr:unnamed protein product [Hyaloperonospora brassicae]
MDAGKSGEVESIVGGSCYGETFAESKPEYWGEVVGDDELAADLDFTDDGVNTTGYDGEKINDEEKLMKGRRGSGEDPDAPHDSAGIYIKEEVLDS